jgi:hypothetical protein
MATTRITLVLTIVVVPLATVYVGLTHTFVIHETIVASAFAAAARDDHRWVCTSCAPTERR